MRLSLTLPLAVVLAACAGTVRPARPPTDGAGTTARPYSTQVARDGVRDLAAEPSLARAIRNGCKARGLVLDGRLGEVAVAVARSSEGAKRAPSYGQVAYHAQRSGLPDPTPEVWVASAAEASQLVDSVDQAITEAARKSALSHCGGAVLRKGARLTVALVWSLRLVKLSEDVPAWIARDGSLRLHGKLLGGLARPVLAVTPPEGQVSRTQLGDSTRFDHTFSLAVQGTYTIELLADGPDGVAVVANFPVAVDIAPQNNEPLPETGPVEASAEQVASALTTLIDMERRRRKLPPLRTDLRLAKIAQAHSQDMLSHAFIAHTSPTTGEASNRLTDAGLSATIVLENIGRGYSAGEIHQGLMESPGHRDNILNADARELGIGVVVEPEGGRLAFLATELFTRLSRDVSIGEAPSFIAREVAARRRARHLAPVKLDAALADAAQKAAERLARSPRPDEAAVLTEATTGVRTLPRGAKAVGAVLIMAADIVQVTASPHLLDAKLGWLGIGVARSRARTPTPLVVVLVIGTGS